MSEQFLKDPDATLDYVIDWSGSYLLSGEQITASSWLILPQGASNDLAVDNIPLPVSGVATVFITGGIAGKIYQLTNRITTDQGRTDERSITIRVEEK
ncbi:MAG: hypothetical protein COB49_12845 [Alphaproteobacteria bacterium]|nr:MAG: hypothetical protein COB49_12845 [Alphaproteobacteria bacterium]